MVMGRHRILNRPRRSLLRSSKDGPEKSKVLNMQESSSHLATEDTSLKPSVPASLWPARLVIGGFSVPCEADRYPATTGRPWVLEGILQQSVDGDTFEDAHERSVA